MMARGLVLAVLAVLTATLPAAGHPHVWIEQRATPVFDGGKLTGLHLIWVFDEMYSAMIREDFTRGKDGKVTPEDMKRIEKEAFMNLKNYDWFVEASLDGKKIRPDRPERFAVSFDDKGRAVYDFILHLAAPADGAAHHLEYGVFDPDFFIDFAAAPHFVPQPEQAGGLEARCGVDRGLKRNTLYGPVGTDRVLCDWRPL
jgi:ABC-type uncharacterized transport system substrate-binding protein